TCVLYECLTSSQPIPGDRVEQQIAGHLTNAPPRPSISRPGLSLQLDAVIAAGMAKDPDERYDTTIELARAARSAITTSIPKPPSLPESQHTAAGVSASAPTQARAGEHAAEPWAPTQARAAEDAAEPGAPTQARPAEHAAEPTQEQLPDAALPPVPWWQRKAVVVPIAIILLMAASVTIVITLSGDDQAPRQGGPLDGTFAVDFAPGTMPNGQPYENAPGGRETWVIESACRADGCVATASKVNGSQPTTSTLVLDKIGGRWITTSATPRTCQNVPTEFWETMSLQPRPDGTLQGEFIVRSTTSCARNQQVTFTRTGDIQPNVSIADPKAQPPRVASSAQGLHGQYRETDKYADGRSAEANFDIQTYCLRTGERCLSFWQNPDDIKTLVFAQGRWVLANTLADSTCQAGGRAHREISLEYPLPQPSQDPITLLTGRGHYTVTGDCPFNSDFDSRAERTGD
ncbi:MAG: protein kinase family protein, partial [Mycobacterium sp.]|nr:protein kinase family protein [Mycobacterium sp.]